MISTTHDTSGFACGFVAHGIVEATAGELAELRSAPPLPAGRTIPPRFLRHCDDQTVAGLAAILRALADPALADAAIGGWGVVGAPRFQGRVVGAAALSRFLDDGPPAISTHLIPQCSLHSLASAMSIALEMHGPSLGVGGGPESLAEAIAVALTYLGRSAVPGFWLVLTGWHPEPIPGTAETAGDASVCRAVALALVPGGGGRGVLRMEKAVGGDAPAPSGADLAGLASWLAEGRSGIWSCALPWGGRVSVEWEANQQRKAA